MRHIKKAGSPDHCPSRLWAFALPHLRINNAAAPRPCYIHRHTTKKTNRIYTPVLAVCTCEYMHTWALPPC